MNRRWRFFVLSAICGLAWGAIVTFLIFDSRERAVFGAGFVFSPVIGVVAGMVARTFKDADVIAMAVMSLLSLYLTAALFGLGTAVGQRLFDSRHAESMLSTAMIFPWMMTLRGFVVWMWPLSYINHRFVGRFA